MPIISSLVPISFIIFISHLSFVWCLSNKKMVLLFFPFSFSFPPLPIFYSELPLLLSSSPLIPYTSLLLSCSLSSLSCTLLLHLSSSLPHHWK
ncbi:hypothetical protein F5X96DRAFT_429943 [Biscogniauxia mediterranea]|nr:hypothetical protein F5X96DRAFT_429943 [Biscogniauxia mediterranea]